ncbi:hypothetical protein LX24_02592 [Desulfallas thermosapovorans DSM 6562]|uniref:Uncharacterized protein n=1 Tax=Desulfallas thermosapovorans DSM 6562 TaxID=1121431 RepID=A0A5S4ZN62_9FIRM|nr:hypothetical protein LX24_02592 [Desulfallas thermosapovorans DSM 6562]
MKRSTGTVPVLYVLLAQKLSPVQVNFYQLVFSADKSNTSQLFFVKLAFHLNFRVFQNAGH